MSVRPFVSHLDAKNLLRTHYDICVIDIDELSSTDDRNFKVLGAKSSLELVQPTFYVVKIVNHLESQNHALHRNVLSIQNHLRQFGFQCPIEIPDVRCRNYLFQGFPTGEEKGQERQCLVKVMTYLDGEPLGRCDSITNTPSVRTDLGSLLAQFHLTLQNCPVENLDVDRANPWALENPAAVLEYLTEDMVPTLKDIADKLCATLKCFDEALEGHRSDLPKGIIHGDFHDLNIIYKEPQDQENPLSEMDRILQTYGIIDFNEAACSYPVLELGRLIGDQMVAEIKRNPAMVKSNDIMSHLYTVTSDVLKGYLSIRTLNTAEWAVLYWSIVFTFCQYLVLGEYSKSVDQNNTFAYEAVEESNTLLAICRKIDSRSMLDNVIPLLPTHLRPGF